MIASPIAGQVGTYRTDPLLRRVARTGRPVAGAPDGKDRHAYMRAPALLDRDVVFAEYRSSEALAIGRRLVPRRDRPVRAAEPADRAPALLRARRPQRRRALPLRPAARAPRRAHRPRQPPRLPGRARARRRRVRALRHVGHARAARHRRLQVRERPPRPPARRPAAVRALRAAAREPRRRPRVPPRRRRVRAAARPHRRGRGATSRSPASAAEVERRLSGVTTSIGFSAAAPEDREPSTLWGRADAALLEAKRRGGNAIVAAAEVVDSMPVVTIEKVRAVRALIDTGAVDVAFQPIWDLSGTRVLGYEALARPRSSELSGPGRGVRDRRLDRPRPRARRGLPARDAARSRATLPKGALLFLNVSPQTLEHDALAGDSLVLAVRGAGLRARAGGARDHRAHRRPQGAADPGGRAAARARLQARARRRRRRQRRPRDAARAARRLHQDRPRRRRVRGRRTAGRAP